MKHIYIFVVTLLFLASCGTSQEELDIAKKALLENSNSGTVASPVSPEVSEPSSPEESTQDGIEIIEFGQNPFLAFNELNIENFRDGEAEISGTTLVPVEKIEVLFSNPDSSFPQDAYVLQTFKSWDTTFTYRASSGFKVLDFGENIYTFRATSSGETSETQIIVRIAQEQSEDTQENIWFQETQLIGEEDNTLLLNLPTSSKYGEPIRLWEASFTYSGIKWFEVEKKIIPPVSCETLAQYLSETQSSWFYWNTCRDIVKEKGIYFNLIRLEGENYVYERQYIDFEHGLFGSFELETGTGITKDTIQEKNTQLKDENFPVLEVVDDLMRDIVNL